ncbi:hypothetical protein HMPREF1531_01846 [Propionibacterium sp. oral taxon 192 str. F0372]|uniref:bifunctional glycosyltransferase family 2/GtrA family protein n=1 Tax=Propionibacterium sp. oral taxon 192 TaxID=671222 RepID=UPI0003530E27|nr:bifunctional glycosyltransferase family 2/GtrA family protein [Propionibacterium sp. oral taxon 192]EPH02538.1 hypothetical protein HMPREF1531_01846 [Propionibacterium sp. oral taxon 192 str. F0372]
MIILIPGYQPDHRLTDLLATLPRSQKVVVVDDGSGPQYALWFAKAARMGATVLTHEQNRGKGQALRTGFTWIAEHHPGADVVCADSDGQHTNSDINLVAQALSNSDAEMVLGVRSFTGKVPLRSRFGNVVTRSIFHMATGRSLADTQTGLRAYPARMLNWLCTIDGDRFDYELKVLLEAIREQMTIEQVGIETIYLDENASSHFRPIADSWLIYRPLLGFCASSLLAFTVDFVLLTVFLALGMGLIGSIVTARVLSAAMNYIINRTVVFEHGNPAPVRETLPRYAGLAAVLLLGNIAVMWVLTPVLGSFWAKLLTEITLLVISYTVQRLVVFVHGHHRDPAAPTTRDLLQRVA